jgi:integrase
MSQSSKITVTLRWEPTKSERIGFYALTPGKRQAFQKSKGKKNPPVRGADVPGIYYLDIYNRGVRSRRALNLRTTQTAQANDEVERLAKEAERKAQDEKWRTSHGFESRIAGSISFMDFFGSLVPTKPKAWRATLHLLEGFPGGLTPLEAIDKAWLESFKEYLLAKPTRGNVPLKQNSAGTYFAKVKAALHIALDQQRIQSVPHVRGISKIDAERSYLTQPELQTLAKAPCRDAETKRAFLFSCYTGLRISDVTGLTWRHVQNGRLEKRIQKTKKVQYLDLPQIALSLLTNGNGKIEHAPDERIFSLPEERTMWDIIQVWAKKAQLNKHISFHTSRHTFAVLALSHTKDLYLVSNLLNHSSVRETEIYAKIIDERKRDAMLTLPAIELS